MIYWGLRSDKEGERKLHLVIALFLAAAGIAASAFVDNPYIKMLLISVGSFGVFAALPLIWTLPTAFLSGAAAAGGIAPINGLGNPVFSAPTSAATSKTGPALVPGALSQPRPA